MTSEPWKAVGQAIARRRKELGLNQRNLAERSRVSQAIIRELEYNTKQRTRSPRTLEALSTALAWPPGHLAVILAGLPDSPQTSEVSSTEADPSFAYTEDKSSMSSTLIGEAITKLAESLDKHLVTYSLPIPKRVEISARARPTDQINVTIECDSFGVTAATMLHWANTLLAPQVRLTGESDENHAEIQIYGKLQNHTNITIFAFPEREADNLGGRTLTHEQSVLWLHRQAVGVLR